MTDYRELYRVSGLPVFQNRMYSSREEARSCVKGDMVLAENLSSGLVSNIAFRPELLEYDADYQNEQGNSPVFQRHLGEVADLIEATMGYDDLVEVGCGKGLFLELLAGRGADIKGYDPTYEGDSPRIAKQYFSKNLGITGKGLILRHVLEHIKDPVEFLLALKEANGGSGTIYIEVPCFDWICSHRAWFDVFYEHVNYFRLSDFQRIFGNVVETRRSFNGQYLSVIADLSSVQVPVRDAHDAPNFPMDFTATLEPRTMDDAVVWGGASKGVIFSLMMERAGAAVKTLIDINPAKQGRFLPATGIQVQPPNEVLPGLRDGSTIYVMNSNYLPEIKAMSAGRFNYIGIDND